MFRVSVYNYFNSIVCKIMIPFAFERENLCYRIETLYEWWLRKEGPAFALYLGVITFVIYDTLMPYLNI